MHGALPTSCRLGTARRVSYRCCDLLVGSLDLSLPFLPEALAGVASLSRLSSEDQRYLNQIRAASYLHLFDLLETCLADAARAHATRDVDARDTLAPLLRLDAF